MKSKKFIGYITFEINIEADSEETAVYIANSSVPVHFDMYSGGLNYGSGRFSKSTGVVVKEIKNDKS